MMSRVRLVSPSKVTILARSGRGGKQSFRVAGGPGVGRAPAPTIESAMAELSIRLRRASPGLLSLPWLDPLEAWRPDEADLRQIQVGPSRHTVRFVQADGVLYALKELPTRTAVKEYGVLRDLEARQLPAVAAVGVVEQPSTGNCILVTEFLARSWQYR